MTNYVIRVLFAASAVAASVCGIIESVKSYDPVEADKDETIKELSNMYNELVDQISSYEDTDEDEEEDDEEFEDEPEINYYPTKFEDLCLDTENVCSNILTDLEKYCTNEDEYDTAEDIIIDIIKTAVMLKTAYTIQFTHGIVLCFKIITDTYNKLGHISRKYAEESNMNMLADNMVEIIGMSKDLIKGLDEIEYDDEINDGNDLLNINKKDDFVVPVHHKG